MFNLFSPKIPKQDQWILYNKQIVHVTESIPKLKYWRGLSLKDNKVIHGGIKNWEPILYSFLYGNKEINNPYCSLCGECFHLFGFMFPFTEENHYARLCKTCLHKPVIQIIEELNSKK